MSLKITINNEEVVCKNNIKIDEKMLSTSSTILNNCYPKSWEDDKDYVSRFYFPKDYSKCKIINQHNITFTIDGETTQDGTPTPTDPISIINKTGNIVEKINGVDYNFSLGDIELCKIGNIVDRIYKENGNWYIEKKIGKVVLDGSENWIGSIAHRFYISQSSIGFNTTSGVCDRFEVKSLTSSNSITFYASNLYIYYDQITGTNNFKTWLNDNNVIVYGVLATPTTTLITDETLLEQLNNVGQDLIFCGAIKNTGKISLNPRQPHYVDLQVLDFKTLLSEGETLNYVITNKTILEAINQVIASISDYGFVLGNVNIQNETDIINAYSTLNKTAYDVFQYISDITQSKWTTRMIDENTIAIDFIDPTLEENAQPINYTQQYFEDNDIIDMSFNYSTNDYRNKQIMTSDEVYGNIIQTQTLVADGYTKTFMCENKIGAITKITINGEDATFITKSEESLGYSGDFIYQPGEFTFNSSEIISTGGIIIISYYPIVKGREIVINNEEISRISSQTNRKGTISRYENRNDTTSSTELIKIGQSYIKYKGQAEITLKIVSKKDLFDKGSIVQFNAPIEELSLEYMVKDKTIDIYPNADEIFYTFELSSNFNSEDAINYFDNQRAKNQGNIGEGEVITRNIDISSNALIQFYDTNIEEVQVINPTSLDFALEGMLI